MCLSEHLFYITAEYRFDLYLLSTSVFDILFNKEREIECAVDSEVLTVMNMRMLFLWVVPPCGLTDTDVSEKHSLSIFRGKVITQKSITVK